MAAAHQSRAVWNKFPGFEADLVVAADDSSHHGTIRVGSDFAYGLTIDQTETQPWVDAKLRSLISHRRPREAADVDVSFADSVRGHVAGRLVVRDDGSAHFRIQDGILREVIRRSNSSWLEISTLKVLRNDDGRYLPEVTSVTYRDPDTGDVESHRTNHFAWAKIGKFYLPERALTVEVAADGKRSVRELVFTNHRLLTTSENALPRSLRVSITDPINAAEGAALLASFQATGPLSIATSGGYRRCFEIAGREYSHIIDPRSGLPVGDVVSASVIAPTAMDADAAATAVSVLGPTQGLALIESLDGFDCCLVGPDGRQFMSSD